MGNSITLHSACEYGDLNSFKEKLDTCTPEDLEYQDENGRTPIIVAVNAMKKSEEDQLNEYGFFDDEYEDEEKNEFMAVYNRSDLPPLEQQIESIEAISTEVCDQSNIHSVEITSNAAEIMYLLLQKKVNVNHQDENGWTALHHACYIQNQVAIRMLLHAGACPVRDNYGLLPQV